MNWKYILLFSILSLATSCGDDVDCCITGVEDEVLNYDGDNATAPQLPPGNYNFSMRLPSTTLSRYEGQSVKAVSFYMFDVPSSAILTIYDDQVSEPGTLIASEDVTNLLATDGWTTIEFGSPITIDGSGLWVGLDVSLDNVMQTVGCDAGPGNVNGDWLYDGADGEFIRFEDRLGESINWNIRVTVGE